METFRKIILAEEQFAREVTLGVIVQRPLTTWYYFIPGMFIFDFLRRGSAIRRYTKYFMFPKKIAMRAAQLQLSGEDETLEHAVIADEVSIWLQSLKLYSEELFQAQLQSIDLLIDHYLKLLQAIGDSYPELIKNAYQNKENFNAYIDRITMIEKEIDKAIVEKVGDNPKLKETLAAEQKQVQKRRRKLMDDIF